MNVINNNYEKYIILLEFNPISVLPHNFLLGNLTFYEQDFFAYERAS